MSDVKKSLHLLWIKNRIWLISLLALSILSGVLSVRSQVDSWLWSFSNLYVEAEKGEGVKDEDFDWSVQDDIRAKFDTQGVTEEDMALIKEKGPKVEWVKNWRWKNYLKDNKLFLEKIPGGQGASQLKINGGEFLAQGAHSFGHIFLAFMLAIVFGGLEHLTSFYEFKRTLPWKRGYDYLAKIFLALILLALSQVSYLALAYGYLAKSPLAQVMAYPDLFSLYHKSLLSLLLVFILVFGLGQLAGSFLGQIGLGIMGFAGLGLPYGIVVSLEYIFFNSSDLSDKLDKIFSKWPDLVQGLVLPARGLIEMDYGLYGASLTGLGLLVLGYFWHKRQKVERTGMLILPPRLSKVIFWLATVATSCLATMVFSGGLFLGSYSLLGLPILALMFFISYKFYKVLFSVRIGL